MLRAFPGRKLVFGHDRLNAKTALIGEAPGKEEERTGKPFVGRAGKLLDKALENAGISRSGAYITNVVKFRPTKGKANRKPNKNEVQAFAPFLIKELKIIKPRVVCTLGATALEALTGRKEITKLRGKIIKIKSGGPVLIILPTYHPAAVLRFRRLQGKFFSDIRKLKKLA